VRTLSSRHLARHLFLSAISLQIALTPLVAQKPPAKAEPKYDVQSETKIKGTIEELKFPEKGKEKEIAYLILKGPEKSVNVSLCPKSFLDDMGITLAKGDEISLTASRITAEGAEILLARDVSKGGDTLTLRDAKGEPVWNWKH